MIAAQSVGGALGGNFDDAGRYIGPVIVIAGPTGSGKTGVAIEIAKELSPVLGLSKGEIGGEIISADSRAIYKYMDIGTAKPDAFEQAAAPHFGIDLVEPGERFTVADWKEYAEARIAEIRERGHVPIVAGGTGLYIDALVFNYPFRGKTGEKAPENATSEQKMCSDRKKMVSGYKVFGIMWDMEELRERLSLRLNKLFVQKLYDETEFLVSKYGWGSQAMKSDIYEYAWGYMQGEYSLDRAKELCLYRDYHLAKRQMTWFKRNQEITWLPLDKIKSAVLKCIQNG